MGPFAGVVFFRENAIGVVGGVGLAALWTQPLVLYCQCVFIAGMVWCSLFIITRTLTTLQRNKQKIMNYMNCKGMSLFKRF